MLVSMLFRTNALLLSHLTFEQPPVAIHEDERLLEHPQKIVSIS